MKRILSLCLVFLGMLVGLTGCGKNPDGPTGGETYEVKFYEDANCTVQFGETVIVNKGETVQAPATNPTKAEDESYTYTFKEWVDYDNEETYDFAKPVNKNLKLYAYFNETVKLHDLYVYVWRGESAEKTYITELEAADIEKQVKAICADAVVTTMYGMPATEFYTKVNRDAVADVVIGGATISPKAPTEGQIYIESIANSDAATEGHLAKCGTNWFANTSRYIGICNGPNNVHFEKAKQVYDKYVAAGPYGCSFEPAAAALEVGETVTVEASCGNCGECDFTLTWGTDDAAIATVAGGVITAVAVGTTNVYCLVGPVRYDIPVTVVEQKLPYTITVMMFSRVYENLETLKAEYAKLADPLATVIWVKGSQAVGAEKVAQFSADVYEYDQVDGQHVDLVVAHTQVTSGHENGLANATYNYSFAGRTQMASSWSVRGDTNYYAAYKAETEGPAAAECAKIIGILAADNPDFFEIAETAGSVQLGQTLQINATGEGITYTSKNTEVATVSETGLVTPIKAGEAIIEVKKGNKVVEYTVTVVEDTSPTYDLLVWVNIRDDQTTKWMSDEDFATLAAQIKALAPTLNIKVERVNQTSVKTVKTDVEAQSIKERVDLVIGRSAMGTNTDAFPDCDATKVALDASWGYNTGYVYTMTDLVEAHKDLADAVKELVQKNREVAIYGENYFTIEYEQKALKPTETLTITPSKTGVTFTTSDATKATVTQEGVITAVAAGNVTITCTLGTYSIEVALEIVEDTTPLYDLLVWVNLRTDKNWMSDADFADFVAAVKALDPTKTIEVVRNTDSAVADVKAHQEEQGARARVDVVIGRSALANQYEGITPITFEASWGYDTGFAYVMADSYEDHAALVSALSSLVATNKQAYIYGDDYFTLESATITVKMGATATITPSKQGVTFTSASEAICTVAAGVITPVAVGNTTITCTLGNYSTTVAVTVIAAEAQPYTITVMMMSREYDNLDALKAEYAKVADTNCTVIWVKGSQATGSEKVAQFSADVYAYDQVDGQHVDLVVAHTQVTSGNASGLAGNPAYGYVFKTPVNIDSSWSSKGDTNHYAAIKDEVTGAALAECEKIIAILAVAKPA